MDADIEAPAPLANRRDRADRRRMVALGCLLLVVLPLLGFMAGAFLGGEEAALWGAAIGLVLACASCGFAGYALVQAGRRR